MENFKIIKKNDKKAIINNKEELIREWWEYVLLLTDYNDNINSKEIKWKKLDLK